MSSDMASSLGICPDGNMAFQATRAIWCPDDDLTSVGIIRGPAFPRVRKIDALMAGHHEKEADVDGTHFTLFTKYVKSDAASG